MNNEFVHYGVKGMKWGVRKEYVSHPRKPTAQTVAPATSLGKKKVLTILDKVERKVYEHHRVNGKKYVDTVVSAGVEFQRVTVNKDEKLDRMYAVYKSEDKNLYAGRLGQLRRLQTGGPVYAKNFTSSKVVKAPSDKKSEMLMRQLMDRDKDFSNYVKSLKDSGFNRVSKHPKNDAELYKNFNLAGIMDQSENGMKQAKKYYRLLKKNGYNAITDLNDRKYSTFKANNPVILFDMKNFTENSIRELGDKEINKALAVDQLRRTGGPFTMAALRMAEREYGTVRHSVIVPSLLVSAGRYGRKQNEKSRSKRMQDTGYIYHHGIKGMKWGVRKKRTLMSRFGKQRNEPRYKKGDSRILTNEELQTRIQRLNLEKQYNNLYSEVRSPIRSKTLKNAGSQFVNQAFVITAATAVGTKVTKPYVNALLDKLNFN